MFALLVSLLGSRTPRFARRRWLWVLMLSVAGASSGHAATGVIRGTVSDKETGSALGFANVILKDLGRGTATAEDGSFQIRGVPVGGQIILASYVGFKPIELRVMVADSRTLEVTIELEPDLDNQIEIEVTGDRPLVDVRNTSSIKTLSASDIDALTIEPTLDAVIQQQAGVTVRDGDIHIRGGRADETLVIVDGVPMKDGIGGGTLANAVSASSASEINVIKGGWDAKYGDALSGIVDVKLKEGTERFKGELNYITDQFSGRENLHFANIQLEGPNPLLDPIASLFGLDRARSATFHLDISTELSDSYLPSVRDLDQRLETTYKGTVFGKSFDYGGFFRPRGDNNWRATLKTGWGPHPAHKLSATFTKAVGFSGLFNTHDIADDNRNITSYPWDWSRRLDSHYTLVDDFYSAAVQWNHTLGGRTNHQLRLRRSFSSQSRTVGGKDWADYEASIDSDLDEAGLGHPFFVDTGDAPDFRDRFVDTMAAEWELNFKSEHHDIGFGLSGTSEEIQYFTLDATSVGEDQPLGTEFDLFHAYPAKGNIFLQDRIEYPGINLKIGMRGDVFVPGRVAERLYVAGDRPGFSDVTRAEWDSHTHEAFGYRYKIRWSPRISVSHPMSDRSHFFFNYGRFIQWPTYFFMYAKTGGTSSESFPRVGNPDLEPQVSAQYEFGAGHKINDAFSLRATVFFKDIYDYPSSISATVSDRSTAGGQFFFYRNLDYARSRGFEIELQRRRTKHLEFSSSYSFSVASGKASDPNNLAVLQAAGADARETTLEEEFMWWNRPHKLTLSAGYQVNDDQRAPRLFGWKLPREWKLSFFTLFQSGEAYTPRNSFGASTDTANSANGPVDAIFDMDFVKKFTIAGRSIDFTVNARNLLNQRTLLEIDPITGRSPHPGIGSYTSDSESPQTLLVNEAAAYETNLDASEFYDQNRAVIRTLTSTLNPAFLSAPRSIRMGLSYAW